MLKVQLICIGKLKEAYWRDACAEYGKRLTAFCKFSILELPEYRLPDKPSQAQIEHALEEEGKKILAAAGGYPVAALCVEGESISSERFASAISDICLDGNGGVNFVIGSSYGLSSAVKEASFFRLSLSSMTFPHQLARVVLCEQIYRAFQILGNGHYHK
jgi:23S rRNA (pseudouridine1915-N3)-methyltransferase